MDSAIFLPSVIPDICKESISQTKRVSPVKSSKALGSEEFLTISSMDFQGDEMSYRAPTDSPQYGPAGGRPDVTSD